MSYSFPADCLDEIFENLEDDKITLYACLLVSRFWCKISIRILWRDIWNLNHGFYVKSAILSTLISCLPVESKELLNKNEIFISTPTSKPPLFDYVAFCKVLSVDKIIQTIHEDLKSDTSIISSKEENYLILKEMLKMFMNRISSLKTLYYSIQYNIPFTSFPGARDCLMDLSELHCSSNINYKLSQICHNLRSLTIYIKFEISSELKELISSQNNLKNLKLIDYSGYYWADIIPTLMKHSNTLTKLHFYGFYCNGYIDDKLQLSFVSSFLNLQEIEFSFDGTQFEDFKKLQYVTFPKLQTLKIPCQCPKPEHLMKFLEINGKNLKELYIYYDNETNLSIDKFCPNLKKLFVIFNNDELDMLKTIFNSCKHLEGIVIQCGVHFLDEKVVLETVAEDLPKNFHELKLHEPELLPENLESFFISWKNRASKNSLSLIIVDDYRLKAKEESMKIIEKYKSLGVIKKFETREYCEEELYL